MHSKQRPEGWIDFLAMSKKIGSDAMLIQGAGGNTSIKNDRTMWVKASGQWLADSEDKEIFVEVSLETGCAACREEQTLRPSIETALHLVLPHKLVAHVHSVNALSWLVREDAYSQLDRLLKGMRWAWVPYVKPGKELAAHVRARFEDSAADIYLLQNHGVVVAADDFEQIYLLIGELEKRLKHTALPMPLRTITEDLPKELGWRLPKYDEVHHLALFEPSRDLVVKRALFPDQVVFLGEAPLVCTDVSDIRERAIKYEALHGCKPGWVVIERQGVLVPEGFSAGAEELLLCLASVVLRISPETKVNYLKAESVAALLDWDAEKYRRSLEIKG